MPDVSPGADGLTGRPDVLSLIADTIRGDAHSEKALREYTASVVRSVKTSDDAVELSMALSALAAFRHTNPPKASLISVSEGEIMMQIWSATDASDVYTRHLTDLEKALLSKHFRQK